MDLSIASSIPSTAEYNSSKSFVFTCIYFFPCILTSLQANLNPSKFDKRDFSINLFYEKIQIRKKLVFIPIFLS